MSDDTARAPLLNTAEALRQFDNDTEFYASLLQDFMTSVPELEASARQALQAGEPARAAAPLHTIKGMTLALGAQALTDFALAHEMRCKQADPTLDGAAAAEALTHLVQETLAAMRHWLSGSGLA